MTRNFGFFVGVGFLWLFLIYTPTIIRIFIDRSDMPREYIMTCSVLLQIIGTGVSLALGIGIIKISLSFCDERKPTVGTLFDANGCFWRFVGVNLLYGLIVLAGMLLLIVPGIIWSIMFCHCKYFVVDKGMGPIEALKASAKNTEGVKWELFGLIWVLMGINWAGVICLYFGVLATYPIVIMANALVYRQLLAQTPELDYLRITEPMENIEQTDWPQYHS